MHPKNKFHTISPSSCIHLQKKEHKIVHRKKYLLIKLKKVVCQMKHLMVQFTMFPYTHCKHTL